MNKSDLPQTGQPLNGGFFAGLINCENQTYAVIIAPKLQGTSRKLPWGEYGKKIEAGNYSYGRPNTEAMAANDSELGKWGISLDINGFKDWYIPSRDEEEILFRHLKPGNKENYCSFRDGENPSAVELSNRFPYLPDYPQQTLAPTFQKGGAEALDEEWLWSSTQYSAYYAWIQGFGDGYQDVNRKDNECAARAVRRELVI